MNPAVLDQNQMEQFLACGYCVVKECFSREAAAQWVDRAFQRLGYDRNEPSTWTEAMVHLPDYETVEVEAYAPKAWSAICDAIGGEDRQGGPTGRLWGDAFIINFSNGADEPWRAPSAACPGWHKDGDFFRHFLDSPEQGLLTIVIWTDILERSGGTFIACDSIRHVAEYLLGHPEGLMPSAGFGDLIHKCKDFVELTGEVGDVVLLHPYMLHASSQNPSSRPRFITNPPVSLEAPMNFHRGDSDDYSLVELATLRALGVERLDFRITHPREIFTPLSKQRKDRYLAVQDRNLAAPQ